MTLHFLNRVANDAGLTQKSIISSLINRIPGSRLLISSLPGSVSRTYVESRQRAFSKPCLVNLIGLELAIDPPPPRGNFVHYDFLKLHYIRHKIKDVSPLRVAALTCNSTLYTLPPKIALNVPDNVSTMACS